MYPYFVDCQNLKVWKFNEQNTLSWLEKKVNKVAAILERKGIHVGTLSAVSNNFVKSVNQKESQGILTLVDKNFIHLCMK